MVIWARLDAELFLDACYFFGGFGVAAGIICRIVHLAVNLDVEFDFGLCVGRVLKS